MRKLWISGQPNKNPNARPTSWDGFRLMTDPNLNVVAGHLAVQSDITCTGNFRAFLGIAPRINSVDLPYANDLADSLEERMRQSHVRERCL